MKAAYQTTCPLCKSFIRIGEEISYDTIRNTYAHRRCANRAKRDANRKAEEARTTVRPAVVACPWCRLATAAQIPWPERTGALLSSRNKLGRCAALCEFCGRPISMTLNLNIGKPKETP